MTAAFDAFIARRDSEKIYLAEIVAAKVVEAAVTTKTLYFGTAGLVWSGNYYHPSIKGLPRFARGMQDVFHGRSFISWGDLELLHQQDYYLDPERTITFDDLISDWTLAGRSVAIKVGGRELAYSDFGTVITGKMGFPYWDNLRLKIPIFSGHRDLEEVKLPKNTFAAGGDMPDDTAERLIPVALGYCKNVRPETVHTNNLVYQVHDPLIGGALNDITTVYDDGVSVGFTKDLANGRFTLTGGAPAGTVTCDVEGAKFDGIFEYTIGGLIEALLLESVGYAAGDIDSTLMTAFNTAIAYEAGLHITSQMSILDIFDKLTRGIPCWFGFSRAGKFQIAEFVEPTGSADVDLTDIEPIRGSIQGERDENLWWKISIGYNYNYDEAKYQVESDSDTDLLDLCPHAKETDLMETCLRDSADAAAVLAKWQTLCGVARERYKLVVKAFFLQYSLGDVASQTLDRFGLDGTLFNIIGVEEDYTRNFITVELWG